MCTHKPKRQAVQPLPEPTPIVIPPEPSQIADPNVAAARTGERKRLKRLRGRNSTIATSPLGDTDEVNVGNRGLVGNI